MDLSSRQLAALSLTGLLILALTSTARAEPKVGSAEWKREHAQKMAEHKRKMAEHKRKFSSSGNTTNRSFQQGAAAARKRYEKFHADLERQRAAEARRQPAPPKFNAAAAPSPLHCLLAFRKAASRATSAEQLLPYHAKVLRDNYRTSQSWGSQYNDLQHDKDMLLGIIRIDDINIQGNKAFIKVVNSCREHRGSYTAGTFTMKGEGNRWRMEAYKPDNYIYTGMPSPPKLKGREKRDFPIYLETYLARLKSDDQQPALQEQPSAESEPTAPESPEPRTAS